MQDAYDYAASGIAMLQVAKIAYDVVRTDILEDLSHISFDRDEEYEFALTGLDAVCDFARESYDKNGDVVTWYFSSKSMMEYYRLCREHSRLTGVPLKNSHYMGRAERHVRNQLAEPDCYYCDYFLQTKINHEWASGIVFRYDASYFCEFLALFSRLLYVFEFYDDEVKALRFEVWKLKNPVRSKVLMLPLPRENERRVA